MNSENLATRASLPPGRVLLRDYVLGPVQESGALWSTHRGWDTRHGDRAVRVTAFRRDVLTEDAVRAASDGWNATFGSLRHSGLASILASGLDDRVFYVVTAEVAGETLEHRIADAPERRLTLAETARIVRQIAEPLSWLHTRAVPIVHEALDPRAVSLTGSGLEACVLNAGLVHVMRQAGLARVERPIPYSTPEQFDEDSPIGPAADQFVLASLAFECLTGAPAYGVDAQAMLSGFRPQLPPDTGERRTGLTRALHRAWSRHPEVRYPSLAAFVTDFTRSAGLDNAAPPESPVRPARAVTLIGLQAPPDRTPNPALSRPAVIAAAPTAVADRSAVTAPTALATVPTADAAATPMASAPVPPPSPQSAPAVPVNYAAPPPRAVEPPALAGAPNGFTPPPPPRQVPSPLAPPSFIVTGSPAPQPWGALARGARLRLGGVVALAALLVIGGSMWFRSMTRRDAPSTGVSTAPTVSPRSVPSTAPPHAGRPVTPARAVERPRHDVARAPTRAPTPAPAPQPQPPPPPPPPQRQAPPQPPPSAPTTSVPARPPAVAPESDVQPTVADVRDALQRGVDDCAARTRRYGRHVFVGVAYERPNGEPVAVRIAGAPILSSMRRCIERVVGTTRSPQGVVGRWQHSFYLRIP